MNGQVSTTPDGQSKLQIGRYTVEARLGEGGMAVTWLCRNHGVRGFTTPLVLKTLKSSCRDPQYITMFVDEARIGAQFDHPNLCKVVELGDVNGVPFQVQEFVDGPTLYQVMGRQAARRHIDVSFGVRVLADVAGALHWVYHLLDPAGHRLNVVHRDVSLSNIVVSRQGVPKLIDFGVARFDGRETETEVGMLKGRVRYMAPEVLHRGVATHQSDLYALGICLYSVSTGVAGPSEERLAALGRPGQSPSEIPAELAQIVARAIARDPAQRWQSGLDLKHALERWLERHGARMGPEEVADRIADLFPQGPAEWRSEDLTVALMRNELSSGFGTLQTQDSAPQRNLLPFMVLALGLSVAAFALVLVLAITLVLMPLRATPEAPQSGVLERAEVALSMGKVDEAAAAVTTLASAPLTPEELERLHALDARVLAARIARIGDQRAVDPAGALAAARALAVERPGNPDVAALIASLEPEAVAAPAPVRPAPSAPRPRPPPAAGPDDLFDARTGRPAAP
ncbi:MAG: serine/threonine-protein kinase [Myxococcota bacterium]